MNSMHYKLNADFASHKIRFKGKRYTEIFHMTIHVVKNQLNLSLKNM